MRDYALSVVAALLVGESTLNSTFKLPIKKIKYGAIADYYWNLLVHHGATMVDWVVVCGRNVSGVVRNATCGELATQELKNYDQVFKKSIFSYWGIMVLFSLT